MKTYLTLSLSLLTVTATFAQTIRRVNADVTVTGTNVYHTIQAAHDAAVAGDVLIVEPGAAVGDLTCTKTLTIYGRGYFLDKNTNYAALQNNASFPYVGSVTLSANNVKLSGLTLGGSISISGASGITISRNNLTSVSINGLAGTPASNITISQNYFRVVGYVNVISIVGVSTGLVSNVVINNNQIALATGTNCCYNVMYENQYCSGILLNQNVFTGTVTGYGFSGFFNTVLTNNIFLGNEIITNSNITNTNFSYNIFTSTSTYTASVGSNNTFNSSLSAQFVSNTGGSDDNSYRIVNGSSLKTASSTGGEVGMFGGTTPYVQYGIPAGPAVLKLLNTGLGNSTTPITATISAASNN